MVVAVLILLIGMLLPALKSAREKSRQIQCASNQKQCGLAMSVYACDFNAFVVLSLWKSGYSYCKGQNARWLEMLDGTWDVEYLKSKEVILCPSCQPSVYETGRCYGTRSNFAATGAEVTPIPYTNGPVVKLSKVNSPSAYLMLVDSFNALTLKQTWAIFPNGDFGGSMVGFHLRHAQKGNILSADMHVESASRNQARNWDLTAGYLDNSLIPF
jgi:hypothetical protein